MFIEINNVKKHYGEGDSRVDVLKGIDIQIEKGEMCGKVGKNYQVKNKITYKDYKKMKWYRDCDEYELYDHSINFDTTENNNN